MHLGGHGVNQGQRALSEFRLTERSENERRGRVSMAQ
eukprot:SAG31_NODE_37311_length_305_cov_0.893204_1_plen_36_part_01